MVSKFSTLFVPLAAPAYAHPQASGVRMDIVESPFALAWAKMPWSTVVVTFGLATSLVGADARPFVTSFNGSVAAPRLQLDTDRVRRDMVVDGFQAQHSSRSRVP